MKKKRFYIIIPIILVIIIFLIIILSKSNKDVKFKDYGSLIEVSYSCSGDMLGNVLRISLDINENKLEYSYADTHNDPITKTVYKVDKEKTANIKKLVNAYDIAGLEKLDIDDRLFVYDACTPTLSLTYKTGNKSYNREYYSISYYYNIDFIRRNIINKIRDNLYDLLIDGNIINSQVIESD